MSNSPNTSGVSGQSAKTGVLAWIERVGNALPHPVTLFLLLAVAIILASELATWLGIEVKHPSTGEIIRPVSLLSIEGLHRILTNLVTNFTSFAPLGTVLVALLGIGIAEASGMIGATMRLLVHSSPKKLLCWVVVFAGVMSNAASEIGYVLLIPLASIIFKAAGRHPIAGLAAAFAGVSGGYSANLLLGTVDPLLSGMTQEAAAIVDATVKVNPACNYFFMAVSTFLITAVGTLVTEKFVEPRLGKWDPADGEEIKSNTSTDSFQQLQPNEKRGMKFALWATLIFVGLILWGTIPESGFLRDAKTGSLLHSPFMSGIVALIFIAGALIGVAYGIGAKTFRNDADAIKGMSRSMETLGSYLVLVFFAAQFVAFFNWTKLGLIIAVEGASLLKESGIGGIPLMLMFILLATTINLFMGSASAKWAIMAPVFIPMFMLVGYPPETVQAAYRIGDSCTNIISPMMSYFALIISFFQRYDKKAGIGTLVATMLPYSISFLIVWSILFVAWMLLDLPFGF